MSARSWALLSAGVVSGTVVLCVWWGRLARQSQPAAGLCPSNLQVEQSLRQALRAGLARRPAAAANIGKEDRVIWRFVGDGANGGIEFAVLASRGWPRQVAIIGWRELVGFGFAKENDRVAYSCTAGALRVPGRALSRVFGQALRERSAPIPN